MEAGRIVVERGHLALSMRAVAQALNVSEPALYRHYDGRDALLSEVAIRGFVRFGEAMEAEQQSTTDPVDAIRRFCRSYVRFAAANRGWFRLQFSLEISESPHARLLAAERLGRVEASRRALLEFLGRALPPGDERSADLYRLVWGTAHGLSFLVVERVFQLVQTDEERIAAADEAINLLVDSIAARLDLART